MTNAQAKPPNCRVDAVQPRAFGIRHSSFFRQSSFGIHLRLMILYNDGMAAPLRIVLAKVGLDGHDRGIKVVARALRDAGMHVIYAGLWQTPEAVVRTAADEDADWLGVSLLSGAHMTLVPRVLELLREAGLSHVGVLVGGI